MGGMESGSVALLAAQLLAGLLESGAEVDLYQPAAAEQVPAELRAMPGLRVIEAAVPLRWERWRERHHALALLVSFAARGRTQMRLAARLLLNHRRRPYDVIFQFSQTELLLLGLLAPWLPPIVVQPSTTAAGELRWHVREGAYARRSEGQLLHWVVRGYLYLRRGVQRRQLRQARLVLAASRAFADSIVADYRLDPARVRVLRHPIALDTLARVERPDGEDRAPLLLFASRISVRKGLELVVELTHRLDDLEGAVRINVLGAPSLWSDYSKHLKDLNPRVSRYVRHLPMQLMAQVYGIVDVVLCPSHFEPFSLVVAEALAAGIPVVASDEVGAAEDVDPEVCRRFPAGDMAAFEREVRRLLEDLERPGEADRLARLARDEARRRFDPGEIGAELGRLLSEAAAPARRSGAP